MTLRNDALAIWQAGVDAVDSARLVQRSVQADSDGLTVGTEHFQWHDLDHIEVVGAGKAGAGMARGLLSALCGMPDSVSVNGWVNVPEDCVADCPPVTLHAARPAGVNEPTPAGVTGTQEIVRRVRSLGPRDLCFVLISGGGSALLPAPVPEITLDDKLAVIRLLASRGATIQQLNAVRSQLSLVKGGGLLQQCRAASMFSLIISDVINDPLDVIASGPTHPSSFTAADAVAILRRFDPDEQDTPPAVLRLLARGRQQLKEPVCRHYNLIVGSNQVAVSAAATEAERRNYRVVELGSKNCGEARIQGQQLFAQMRQIQQELQASDRPVCLLAGGETTVRLAETAAERKGGRNQEVVLAAVCDNPEADDWRNLVLLSGGTDGEDGPTDAAGAIADADVLLKMQQLKIAPSDYLQINNSYPFFDVTNGLVITGPTHTNVMDLAVGLVRP